MMYVIDFSSDEAFYMQLRNQIILGIANCTIHDGDSLPSVRDMAENIGINMHTVNKAYLMLKQEGYVRLDRRRGAVIDINIDKMQAMAQLRTQLRVIIAQAVCNDINAEEIHSVMDEILSEFIR